MMVVIHVTALYLPETCGNSVLQPVHILLTYFKIYMLILCMGEPANIFLGGVVANLICPTNKTRLIFNFLGVSDIAVCAHATF